MPLLILFGLGALGYWYYEKHHVMRVTVPMGTSTTPLGQTAQMAAATSHPAAVTPMGLIEVQQALNQLGAMPPIKVDGQSGAQTIQAIKTFQSKANISVDGKIGPETAAALRTALAATGALVTAGGYYVGAAVAPQSLGQLVSYMNGLRAQQGAQVFTGAPPWSDWHYSGMPLGAGHGRNPALGRSARSGIW